MPNISKLRLHFKTPSGTSRGVLLFKDSWFISEYIEEQLQGIGEVSLIEGLSPEDPEQVESVLNSSFDHSEVHQPSFPAIEFGRELFLRSLKSHSPFQLFDSAFVQGQRGIPINGLIWMGDKEYMRSQIYAKLQEGFRCIKLKIGAIDFKEELELLSYIRRQFQQDELELRVDANGAFHPEEALDKLKNLAKFHIHSIEQPIPRGNLIDMALLCEQSPIPIALDEELIGIKSLEEKKDILDKIRPQFIILKPSLVGGFKHCEEWINIAESQSIGWWATSALESNIGLNAIAQWISTYSNTMYQGLGTGGLFTNNIGSPLYIKDAAIWYDPKKPWDLSKIVVK